MHVDPLLLTLGVGFPLAVGLGLVAHRLRMSPILGYLVAGIAVGPYTPGFAADTRLAAQLAEIGVVLLMFGVGLRFHWRDLAAVRRVAVPGALLTSGIATGLGLLVGLAAGFSTGEGLVLGLSVSVASTVVLLRVLTSRGTLDTPAGHVAVGWLVVEDLLAVLALVLLPAAAPALRGEGTDFAALARALAFAVGKIALLVALVALVGSRVLPWILARVARTRSRELFTLSVLSVSLAIAALAASAFDASPALGAFLAGMVVAGSALRHQAAADVLPLRDAFAVLFFLAAGMQLDPTIFVQATGLVVAVLGIVLVGRPLVALGVVVGLGWSVRTALTVAIGLAQIGEFSFLLASVGGSLGLVPTTVSGALVAAAILSIALNPWLMGLVGPLEARLGAAPRLGAWLARRTGRSAAGREAPVAPATDARARRAIVVGYGPTGRAACDVLALRGVEPVVVESNLDTVRDLTAAGRRAIYGDARRASVLEDAGLKGATLLLVSIADAELASQAIVAAKGLDAEVPVYVRARYLAERDGLLGLGATAVTVDEEAVAGGVSSLLLRSEALDGPEAPQAPEPD